MTSAPAAHDWDTAAIALDAMAILRMDPETDPDADRVISAAVVACAVLDQELDTETPLDPIPAPVEYAAVLVTIELYRRKDAPFGVLNAWSVDDVMIQLSPDTLRSVRKLVRPYKARFGVS